MADVETAIAVEAAAVAAVCEAESVQVGAMSLRLRESTSCQWIGIIRRRTTCTSRKVE